MVIRRDAHGIRTREGFTKIKESFRPAAHENDHLSEYRITRLRMRGLYHFHRFEFSGGIAQLRAKLRYYDSKVLQPERRSYLVPS